MARGKDGPRDRGGPGSGEGGDIRARSRRGRRERLRRDLAKLAVAFGMVVGMGGLKSVEGSLVPEQAEEVE